MRVIVVNDYAELSALAAGIVDGVVWATPGAVLGLPTGATPEGMYQVLVRLGMAGDGVKTFNLDEYVGLEAEHPQSYHSFMKQHLFDRVNIAPENRHLPDGTANDLEAECQRYEEAIRLAGGIDLMVLGLGPNGHIGFNEPGVSWSERTRPVKLAEETRQANARFFGQGQPVPTEALTMGIGNILESKRILLLVSGANKAAIVKEMLDGPVTTAIPATALRNHPAVTVIMDRAAASIWVSPEKVS